MELDRTTLVCDSCLVSSRMATGGAAEYGTIRAISPKAVLERFLHWARAVSARVLFHWLIQAANR